MQFTSPLRLEAHTFTRGEPFDLTPYVKTVSWSESTRPPWDSLSAELALPLDLLLTNEARSSNEPAVPPSPLPASLDGYLQSAGSQARGGVASSASRPQDVSLAVERTVVTRPGVGVDPGLWLKLIEVPTGRTLAFGRIVDSSGQHGAGGAGTVSSGTSIQTVGAMQFLRTLATEVVVALRERVGGLMDGNSWRAYMEVIQKLIRRADFGLVVGKRGLLASLAPVAIPPTLFPGITTLNELFSVAHTDETGAANAPMRVMDEVPIAGATAIASLVPNGTVADVILGIFQREPRLIELFPSLEAKTNNPLEPGYADARPVLVHRIAPWRTGPLSNMVVGSDGQPAGGPIQPRFEKPTWSIEKALTLKRHEVYRLSHRRTEDARINAVTVNWTVAGGTPARLLPMAGLPLFDRIDVLRHGAKLMELNWDMAPDQSGDLVPHATRLRTVGLLGWHFYGLGHVFRVGSIECPYLGLRARAGEPVAVDIGHKTSPFTAYMTRVTHTATVQGSGEVSARTSIEFDRGLFDEKKRAPLYFVKPEVPTREPRKAESEPETPPFSGTILFGSTEIPYPSTFGHVRQLRQLPPADRTVRTDAAAIDIFCLHFTGGKARRASEVIRGVLDKSGGGAHFVLQPDGLLVQYMNLSATAAAIGQDDMNRRSINIEIMSPGAGQLYGKPDKMAGPWRKVTGWSYNTRDISKKWFYGATVQQEQAVRELIRFLAQHFGIKLRAPAYRGKWLRFPQRGKRCDQPESDGGLGLALQPGVWHHAELYQPTKGRSDAMGLDIQDVL